MEHSHQPAQNLLNPAIPGPSNRPDIETRETTPERIRFAQIDQIPCLDKATPRPSTTPNASSAAIENIIPEHVSPHPKAGERKTCKGKRKRATAILTDTTVKDALAAEQAAAAAKRKKIIPRQLSNQQPKEKKKNKKRN